MKQHRTIFRRLAPAALAVTLLMTSATPALAVTYGNAQVMPNRTIVVDGVARTFYAINGQEVHPISYGGTTYLPVRSIGELMNKNVDWNNDTKTITLTSPRTAGAATGTPDVNPQESTVSVSLRDDFTIIVDGVTQQFYDAGGNRVYPLLHNGVTYLPIRAVGELMGKVVSWDNNTQTVTISGNVDSSGNLVTDADSFGPGSGSTGSTGNTGNTGNTGSTSYISAETAKAKALAHAGLSASQVTFVRAYPDWDDGRYVYDVEFYTSDYKEYDYEIDANTGAVLSFDYDADHYTRPTQPSTGTDIGLEKAKSIALGQVSGASSSHIRQAKRDYDDGRLEYDVKIVYNNYEYEFEIDGTSGTILSRDVESIWD